jgi:hypothetical protein
MGSGEIPMGQAKAVRVSGKDVQTEQPRRIQCNIVAEADTIRFGAAATFHNIVADSSSKYTMGARHHDLLSANSQERSVHE